MSELKPLGGIKPGVGVTIGGVEYVCPELDFGGIRNMSTEVKRYAVTEPSGRTVYKPDAHELLAYILLNSLRRNYEGANAMWLNETLLGSEIDAAAEAELQIMRNSGMKVAEGDSSGEASAVTG